VVALVRTVVRLKVVLVLHLRLLRRGPLSATCVIEEDVAFFAHDAVVNRRDHPARCEAVAGREADDKRKEDAEHEECEHEEEGVGGDVWRGLLH